ncbi:MAG: Hsp20/alpha crystallin family protein [Deltaproteobacteria bacterium]|nr:Hsp20/alpha crystallin family protein [Deltaproteobacteria bacterium]
MNSMLGRPWALLAMSLVVLTGMVAEGVAVARVYQVLLRRASASGAPPALADPRNLASQTDAADDPPWPAPTFAFHGDPFAEMERMQRQMERQMRGMWTAQASFGRPPPLHLSEQSDRYVLTVQVPDEKDAQVRVDAEAHQVTLRIERQTSSGPDGDANRRATSSLASTQSLRLAHAVDADHVTIERSGDTMTINLPKLHETRGTVI